MEDHTKLKVIWNVSKFKDPTNEIAKKLKNGASIEDILKEYPESFISTTTFNDNVTLREGLYLFCGIISGIDVLSNKWSYDDASVGVGNSDATASADQTGLLGTSKTYSPIDATYPRRAASETAAEQFIEWRGTFATNEANHDWKEHTVVNDVDDSGKNLNRKVENLGTKTSDEAWTLSLKIIFS